MAADVADAREDGKQVESPPAQQHQLVEACCQGDLKEVQALISKGLDPNVADESGRHPLHLAITNQHTAIVAALLAAGGRTSLVSATKDQAFSAACVAAQQGDVDMLQLLHEHDPGSISEPCKGGNGTVGWSTPLYQAALHRRSACVDFLLAHCALWVPPGHIHQLLSDQAPDPPVNPVCAAALSGDMSILRTLLNHGGSLHGAAAAAASRGYVEEAKQILGLCPECMRIQEAAAALKGAVDGKQTDLALWLLQSFPIQQVITREALISLSESAASECNSELMMRCARAVLYTRDPDLCRLTLLAAVSRQIHHDVVLALLAAGVRPDEEIITEAARSRFTTHKQYVLQLLGQYKEEAVVSTVAAIE